jgi:transcriptional regulator with XRE-family HTH domain
MGARYDKKIAQMDFGVLWSAMTSVRQELKQAVKAMDEAYELLFYAEPEPEPEPEIDYEALERRRNDLRRHAIRVNRKLLRCSQQWLGEVLGFPKATAQTRVAQIENGVAKLTELRFESIAKVWGMTPDELEAVGTKDAAEWQQRILKALKNARGPMTIAMLADRAGLSTSDCWAELEPLIRSGQAVKSPSGGIAISNTEGQQA